MNPPVLLDTADPWVRSRLHWAELRDLNMGLVVATRHFGPAQFFDPISTQAPNKESNKQ